MSELIEDLSRLSEKDHARGCLGREYTCTCGYDPEVSTATLHAAATIAALQAELAESREVPGRIVAWLRGEAQYHRKHPEDQAFARHIATAIEARDWIKP